MKIHMLKMNLDTKERETLVNTDQRPSVSKISDDEISLLVPYLKAPHVSLELTIDLECLRMMQSVSLDEVGSNYIDMDQMRNFRLAVHSERDDTNEPDPAA